MGASTSTGMEGQRSAPAKKSQVIEFHSSSKWNNHFDACKENNKLIVIYFTASWCGPCRYMEPIVNQLAAENTDVEFVKIDVDELDDVAQKFEVQAMPTFVLVKNGKELQRVVGARNEDLKNAILQKKV